MMATLWERLSSLLGSKFITQFGYVEDEDGEPGSGFTAWCEVLQGCSKRMLVDGFRAFMNDRNPFISAKEFKQVCLFTRYTHPEIAYKEAVQNAGRGEAATWSNGEIREAARNVGSHVLKHATNFDTGIKTLFLTEYTAVCDRALQGEVFSFPIANLEYEPDHTQGFREFAAKHGVPEDDQYLLHFMLLKGDSRAKSRARHIKTIERKIWAQNIIIPL